MKELSEQLQELFDKGFIRPSSSPWGALDEKEHKEHLKATLELLKKEELYAKTHISQRVVVDSQRVDLLMEDMIAHQETIHIVKDEAYAAREAWAHSIGLSQAVHSELQTHQEQASGTDDRDSLSDGRHETRDERHAGRVVKFATCTMLDAALTWWNNQIRSLGPDTYSMTWEVLKKKMTDKYYPQGEIKKLEIELWNLKVKDNNVSAYTEHFQELTLICTKFVTDETEKIDKNFAPMQKGSPTTKERLRNHLETTMVTNSRPPKGKMSPGSTIWGHARGSRTVGICPSAPSAIFITMACVPRCATSVKK
nr:reverse transcriptase domain-containing protein [Tanacetum cinerariifolium]